MWQSTDGGVKWSQLSTASWSRRSHFGAVVLPSSEHIIVMGGEEPHRRRRDVWRSGSGGASWEPLGEAAWSARNGFMAVVLPASEHILVMGGWDGTQFFNDVWRSKSSGASWESLGNAEWSPRGGQYTAVVLPSAEQVLVMGDWNGVAQESFNEVWRSADGGETWSFITTAGWSARYAHATVVLPKFDEILVIGGFDGSVRNDVWSSCSGGWVSPASDVPTAYTTCNLCEKGKFGANYQFTTNPSTCQQCAAGMWSSTKGATSSATCQACAAGTWSSGGASNCSRHTRTGAGRARLSTVPRLVHFTTSCKYLLALPVWHSRRTDDWGGPGLRVHTM